MMTHKNFVIAFWLAVNLALLIVFAPREDCRVSHANQSFSPCTATYPRSRERPDPRRTTATMCPASTEGLALVDVSGGRPRTGAQLWGER